MTTLLRSLSKFSFHLFVCLFMYLCVACACMSQACMYMYVSEGQRATCKSGFSPSIVWGLEMEFWLLDLVALAFNC